MKPKEDSLSHSSRITLNNQAADQLTVVTLSRRTFISTAASVVAAIGTKRFVLAQSPEPNRRPTITDGPPPCEGPCHVYPFILIPRAPNDDGHRSTDATDFSLGQECSNVWFEDYQTGQTVTTLIPGQGYQIAATINNIGSGPTFTLCVDFMVWTKTIGNKNVYDSVSSTKGLALMQEDHLTVRSKRWSPTIGIGRKPGDAIIRAYDPWADHYTETGEYLYVNRDRHLAHKAYT